MEEKRGKNSIELRVANPTDLEVLVEFQLQMAYETEKLVLERSTTTSGVKHVLQNPQVGEYLLAINIYDAKIVGSLLLLKEWSDWRNKEVIWIHSVFVEKAYRRLGVFTKMYEWVKEKAKTNEKIGGIRLFVEKNNHTAQNCYKKLGMKNDHYDLYEYFE